VTGANVSHVAIGTIVPKIALFQDRYIIASLAQIVGAAKSHNPAADHYNLIHRFCIKSQNAGSRTFDWSFFSIAD
jgi:hypothetical protein